MADIDNVLAHAKNVWSAMTVGLPNLEQLPSNINQSLIEAYNKLTQSQSLPSLGVITPIATPAVVVKKGLVLKFGEIVKNNLMITTILLSSVGSTLVYFYLPASYYTPLKPYIPLLLLPKSTRPIRIKSTNSNLEVRREVVLVLGVNSNPLLIELILNLEKKGFVVICTVNKSQYVEPIERKSQGFIKALLLDDSDATSVGPFLISFLTAISLRFPLHSSGDPYSRPSNSLNLTAIINGLSLSNFNDLSPIEFIQPTQILIGEKVATIVGVLNGVLPVMRIVSERPGAEECVIINLASSPTVNLALPFQALASASDAAITSIFQSLSRELSLSKSNNNIRITTLEIGFFTAPSHTMPGVPLMKSENKTTLNSRLHGLYAPALARRSYLVQSVQGERNGLGRKSSDDQMFYEKIHEIIVYGRGGQRSRIGAGAKTYRIASLLPSICIDKFLLLQDNLLHHLSTPLPSIPTVKPTKVEKGFSASMSSSTTSLFPVESVTSHSSGVSEQESGDSSEEMDELLSHEGNGDSQSFSFLGSEVDWKATQ